MSTWGIVVGRFQVPDLHPAHHILIGHAMRMSDQIVVMVGVPKARGTNNDPLDFPTRRLMLAQHYPQATIIPIEDRARDLDWSRDVDKAIKALVREEDAVTLYCGRDGFKPAYKGHYRVEEIDAVPQYRGTDLRTKARKAPLGSQDFRQGVIYGIGTKYATTNMTVDMAVIHKGRVLMAQRPDEHQFRFPGGFVGFTDKSLEQTCHRELMEELGVEATRLDAFEYVASMPVDDWRYRDRPDQRIMTSLFAINLTDTVGDPHPDGEELAYSAWVSLDQTGMEQIVTAHRPLFMALIRHLAGNPRGISEGPKTTKTPKVNTQ